MKYFILIFFITVVFIFISKGSVLQNTGFLSEDVTIKDKNGNLLATALLGTPVKKNKISGWVDKKTLIMYAKPDRQLEYAVIKDPVVLQYDGSSDENTYSGSIDFSGIDMKTAPDLKDSLKSYEKKYYENCGTCHTAYDAKRYTIKQWKGIMITMRPHAGLSEKEMSYIYRYIKLMILSN